jgi:hypothetical protein
VESFVGHGNAIHLTIKYDVKEVIPLLMRIFDPPNLTIAVFVAPCDRPTVQVEKKDDNMFGVINSMQEFSWALVIIDFSLFERLSILQYMFVNPLS